MNGVVDSVRLCPCCGKRMVTDVGQDLEPDDYGPVLRQVESCLSCCHTQQAPPDHPFDWHNRVQTVLAHNFEVWNAYNAQPGEDQAEAQINAHSGCGKGEPCRVSRPGMAWRA